MSMLVACVCQLSWELTVSLCLCALHAAFASPYVVGAHTVSDAAVGVVLAIGSVAAGVAAYWLPETAGKGLDETDERDSAHRLSEVLLPDNVDRSHR